MEVHVLRKTHVESGGHGEDSQKVVDENHDVEREHDREKPKADDHRGRKGCPRTNDLLDLRAPRGRFDR